MLLFEDQPPLPAGLWLVKWIDRFRLGHDAESPKVDFALQKLPFADISAADSLSSQEVAELLGTKPRAAGTPEVASLEILLKPLLAAYIPSINVGDIFEGSKLVGRLPQMYRRVVLDGHSAVADLRIGTVIDAPSDWTAPNFRVLNRFEYQLGGIPGVEQSRCLVFRQNGTEYILPKLAIFRAFYCLSSSLINALCSGPWSQTAKEVISFKRYESGIATTRSEESGSWKIVLQDGTLSPMVHALALLWFDEHGRKQAESLHTDSLSQTSVQRGGDGRWYASANIPHRFEPLPFHMGLQGFSLRPFRPSRRKDTFERFLVTAITGSSWSMPDQMVEFELDGSNAQGEEQHPSEDERPYGQGKSSVEGDPGAIGTSISDPNPKDATNIFMGNSFEYFDEPKVQRQIKQSSKTYPPSSQAQGDGEASLVSGGAGGTTGASPAPANTVQRVRASSQQFDFLVRALEELKGAGVVSAFDTISTTEAGLWIDRNGLVCWSLLRARHRKNGLIPKRGWEVVHEREAGQSTAGMESQPASRHARCLLVLHVQLHSRNIVLLEIEPRAQESAYCLIAFEQDSALLPSSVAPVLDAIREHEGRLRDANLAYAFATMTSNKVVIIRHCYTYSDHEDKTLKVATGLRSDILGKSLLAVLQSSPATALHPNSAVSVADTS